MRKILTFILLIGILSSLWYCSPTEEIPPGESVGTKISPLTAPGTPVDAGRFGAAFPADQLAIADQLKQEFEAGLAQIFGADRELRYQYEQHARRLRMQYFDEDPISDLFPFNGGMPLNARKELLAQLPFFSLNCGFQTASGEIVNYYCPNLDTTYFQYLDALVPTSTLITQFSQSYQEQLQITPAIRHGMLTGSIENLDLSNYDHQLFYALFQLWINEEMQALQVIKTAQLDS